MTVGGPVVDFTSALFLGLRHPAEELPRWSALTTGRPALLDEPGDRRRAAAALAVEQGADDGLVARSTLHALVDVLTVLTEGGGVVAVDEDAYPVARWAIGAVGARSHAFAHRDAADADRVLGRARGPGRPVVLVDGWCPGCGRPAPLRRLAAVARAAAATLVVDDTLAAGILGRRGCGTPSWAEVPHRDLVWVASAAKGWGSPVAVVTGPAAVLGRIRRDGPTRMHTSPPSRADIAALSVALGDPADPDRRRARLAELVHILRQELPRIGLRPIGRPFPVVPVEPIDPGRGLAAVELHRALKAAGLRALLVHRRCRARTSVSFCVRADHTDADLGRLLSILHRLDRSGRRLREPA